MLCCKLRLLRVLPPSRATNFCVAESKSDIYFLQHENLLREKVVIRATNNLNLQRQHCCTTSCKKMLPVLLDLYKAEFFFLTVVSNVLQYCNGNGKQNTKSTFKRGKWCQRLGTGHYLGRGWLVQMGGYYLFFGIGQAFEGGSPSFVYFCSPIIRC